MTEIKPIRVDGNEVVLSRVDYDRLLNAAEDAADLAGHAGWLADRKRLGEAEHDRLHYTSIEVDRMLDQEVSVITIWRERESLSVSALAASAGVSRTYLTEIEGGKKPGSATALKAIASALRVPMEMLVE